MRLLNVLLVGSMSVIFTGCNKKGCTNSGAINFSIESTKDDGSCKFPEYIIITSAEIQVLPNSTNSGDEWDFEGLPDCYIKILGQSVGMIDSTDVKYDVETNRIIEFEFSPDIVIPTSTFSHSNELIFTVYDADEFSNSQMANFVYQLSDMPDYNKNWLFLRRQRFSSAGIILTLNVDWK